VEQGINLNKKDSFGSTLLHISCLNGHEGIVKYLAERGHSIIFSGTWSEY